MCIQDEYKVEVKARFLVEDKVIPPSFIWTDGKAYTIKVLAVQRGASLKKRGNGIRYHIEAEGKKSYLFRFGDSWIMAGNDPFMPIPDLQTRYAVCNESFQNIIHEGYENPLKVAVEVEALFPKDGQVLPLTLKWEDGHIFEIDRVRKPERAANIKAGIFGLRYEVRILEKRVCLYRDGDIWLMERKNRIVNVLDVHGRPV